jgi:two-component system response regulator HydG
VRNPAPPQSSAHAAVWVVDDHRSAAQAIAEIAGGLGHPARTFPTAELAADALARSGEDDVCDVLVTDVRLPGMDGLALLDLFRTRAPRVVVIVVTAHGSVEDAVRAMRAGAHDFLTKPLAVERVESVLRNAMARAEIEAELARVRLENRRLRAQVLPDLVFRSDAMRAVLEQAHRAAASDATVLVLGETGTGKERIARAIHEASARASGPFVAVHLAALAEGVIESELFGHERGAFTGATSRHPGCFEQARGGTLFLDELGEVDPRTQVRLLRVLQERVVLRVGGTEEVKVDARLVAATHRDLAAEVAAGRFRSDLYYRLDVVAIRVPPLRERGSDVPVLLAHFLDVFATRYGRPLPNVPADVAQALLAYDWPGNVRELENVAERLVVMGDATLGREDLPARIGRRAAAPTPSLLPAGDIDLGAFLDELEGELLRRALQRAGGNKAQAARSLAVSREGLRYKLQKHGLDGG